MNLQPYFVLIRRIAYITLGTIDNLLVRSNKHIVVLCYHSVSDDSWRFSISPKVIKKQINFLSKKYKFITLEDLRLYLDGKVAVAKPSVILNFDDGYRDVLILKDYFRKKKIFPTLFILSDPQNANRKELGTSKDFLDKRDLKALIQSGWTIGSHSKTHSVLTELSEKQLEDEIKNSKEKLERELGIEIKYFSYPKGKYSKRVIDDVKKSGYQLGLSMDDSIIGKQTNKYAVPRVGIDQSHSFLEFKKTFLPSAIIFRQMAKRAKLGGIFDA